MIKIYTAHKLVCEAHISWEVNAGNHFIISILFQGLDFHERTKSSWWEALILAAASRVCATILLREYFTHNMKFGKLRIKNPFIN